jgi:hypothetical protein
MNYHDSIAILMAAICAAAFVATGLGLGLTMNVKGFSFTSAAKYAGAIILGLSAVLVLLTHKLQWAGFTDLFLSASMLLGVLLTQDYRPPRYISATRHTGRQASDPDLERIEYEQQVNILA